MRSSRRHASPKQPAVHISGAETLADTADLRTLAAAFIERALSHPRGSPDSIVLTIEELGTIPRTAPLLRPRTLACREPKTGQLILRERLRSLGISDRAIGAAMRVLGAPCALSGAAIIDAASGRRLDRDRKRGVRVSRLGVDPASQQALNRRLRHDAVNTTAVREAIVLASKVAAHPDVIAEVCVSDDPDYTTGYIASRRFGYERIPHLKPPGSMQGGRVFFVRDSTEISALTDYLERTPVLVGTRGSSGA